MYPILSKLVKDFNVYTKSSLNAIELGYKIRQIHLAHGCHHRCLHCFANAPSRLKIQMRLADFNRISEEIGNCLKAANKDLDFLSHLKQFNINWLLECKNKNILDVGCGKSSSIISWRKIEPKNIVGLDIDPICIFKSSILSNSNKYLWFNINEDWNIRSQVNYFGKIWESTQMFKMNHLLQSFDYIIFNFSIHYCTNYNKLVKNLNTKARNGTLLKFNWINYNKISIFDVIMHR